MWAFKWELLKYVFPQFSNVQTWFLRRFVWLFAPSLSCWFWPWSWGRSPAWVTIKFLCCNCEMLLTPAGDPFVATGQSTTTAPAGRLPPPFVSRTWFTLTPPGKTFTGNPDTVVDGAVVVEIAPKETLPAVVQSPLFPRGIGCSTVVWITLLSNCMEKTNWIKWRIH